MQYQQFADLADMMHAALDDYEPGEILDALGKAMTEKSMTKGRAWYLCDQDLFALPQRYDFARYYAN